MLVIPKWKPKSTQLCDSARSRTFSNDSRMSADRWNDSTVVVPPNAAKRDSVSKSVSGEPKPKCT
ncbi:hypothetical protein D3C77_687920 [compost metagenome]